MLDDEKLHKFNGSVWHDNAIYVYIYMEAKAIRRTCTCWTRFNPRVAFGENKGDSVFSLSLSF